jgi:hypothetical protein
MERYFLLTIVVTLVGVTTQKSEQEANFRSTQLKERRVIAAITTCENSADYTDILTPYTKFKTSAWVVYEKEVYRATAYKNSEQKMIKSRRRRVNEMPGSTNPRILYNILRSLPMGEPYFIQ